MASMKTRVITNLTETLASYNTPGHDDTFAEHLAHLGAQPDFIADMRTHNDAMREELPRLRTWVEANCRSHHTLTQIQKMAGQAGFSPEALWVVWQS